MDTVARSSNADIRVLHVVGGRLSGGAARGARVLSDEIRRQGANSHVLCADPTIDGDDKNVSSVASGLWARGRHFLRSRYDRWTYLRRRPADSDLFSLGLSGINLARHPAYRDANIIHLHWINGGLLSIEGVGQIDKPFVWSIRDMWPFTGGCHCALDCIGYTRSCEACPQLASLVSDDLAARVLDRKKKAFSSDATYVGISSWIAEAAASSSLLSGHDVRMISNCIDTSVFYPVPKDAARARLGLPQTASIVLYGALSHSDRHKGHALLHQARAMLSCEDITFASFGESQQGVDVDFDFGVVTDDQKLRDIYAASDLLVFPSLQESFGKVPAEAMACGAPVVVFDATGLKDIVTHKETGYAAEPYEPADLAAGIAWCLEDRARLQQLSQNAARDAGARFAPGLSARAYIDLYREKLAGRG